eukprot:CAMPEP_0114230100 /NCGR_PEP_ID=MMETSP0058-20121206/3278_1 /TAXON_ID=36894 /ORGANISM="Pyramimonas parkeae, CCMP726" /LENGTH=135 /DNA_ID=CAMNT_0001341255 /DNA_START=500 /DNA_END=908 /DNA_ORIENTATION=-
MATSVEHRRNSGDTLDVFLPICMQALDLGSVMITGACPHSDATSTATRSRRALSLPASACAALLLGPSHRLLHSPLLGLRHEGGVLTHAPHNAPLGPGVEGAEQDGARQEEMHCLRAALGGGAAGTRASRPRRLR